MSSMKRLIPIVGALGLAIIGSALWEALRKPIIFASFVMLKLVTLGIDSFRDSIYADAAAQIPERASSLLLALTTGIVTGVSVTIIIEYRKRTSRANEQLSPLLSSISRKQGIAMYQFYLIAVLLGLFIVSNRQIYVIRVSAYANQLQQIAAPFLNEDQILVYSSSFAQSQTRSDYVALVDDLRKVISSHKATDPGFAIF
jgi:hypothetical protein